MHIDFDDPRAFIMDTLMIGLQTTWLLKIDDLIHLLTTAGTFIYLIIRVYYFIKDRKKKQKKTEQYDNENFNPTE
jgi:hypothetical protein